MRAVIVLTVVALVACGVTAGAAADGLPVLGIDVGSVGVTVPGSPERIVTIAEGKWTLVERVARDGGQIRGFTRVKGTFTIPAVAYDSSASGLSADGRKLVLIEPRNSFPRATTTFALLDARGLGLYRRITLRGDFSFDALSPRGRTMYLVNYTHPGDPTRYSVRAYDLQANRLLPKAIVDPAERSDKMRGSPITRLMSADGRWAYTLYDGAGAAPFVHALDTQDARRALHRSRHAGRSGRPLVAQAPRRCRGRGRARRRRRSAGRARRHDDLHGERAAPGRAAGSPRVADRRTPRSARRRTRRGGYCPRMEDGV